MLVRCLLLILVRCLVLLILLLLPIPILLLLRGAAGHEAAAVPLVQVQRPVPMRQLALMIAVAHPLAAGAQLADGRCSAEVALADNRPISVYRLPR
jgi:hypothetical protein